MRWWLTVRHCLFGGFVLVSVFRLSVFDVDVFTISC
jgi:hypothetical protein